MKVKNRRPVELRRGVVYEVPCRDWNKAYIGETGRSLQERIKEHKYAVKSANMKNGIAAHAWTHQHHVDWDAAKARAFEQQNGECLKPFTSRRQETTTTCTAG